MAILLGLAAFVTGLLVPVQLALNGQLGQALKSAYLGAFFIFLTGVVATGLVLTVSRTALPGPATLGAVPTLAWTGGIVATGYILAVVMLVPRLGVGSTAILIIAGQITGALLLDALGAFGTAQVALTPMRIAGAIAVLAGAAAVRFG